MENKYKLAIGAGIAAFVLLGAFLIWTLAFKKSASAGESESESEEQSVPRKD